MPKTADMIGSAVLFTPILVTFLGGKYLGEHWELIATNRPTTTSALLIFNLAIRFGIFLFLINYLLKTMHLDARHQVNIVLISAGAIVAGYFWGKSKRRDS